VEKNAMNSRAPLGSRTHCGMHQNLEGTTMNELSKLTRQHYEKNEAGASLVSKVAKIRDFLLALGTISYHW
jgi:hypothetical protein